MSASEKSILNDTLEALSALPETFVWRNNTGQAWQGEPVRVIPGRTLIMEPGMVILRNARPVQFGLVGSGDGIGAHAGYPLMIETKSARGRQRDQQEKCEIAWRKAGGIYVLGHDPEEIVRQVRRQAIPDLLRR